MKKRFYFAVVIICFTTVLSAQISVYDNFVYPSGTNLHGQGGWRNYAGSSSDLYVGSVSLSMPDYVSSGIGNCVEILPTRNDDCDLPFANVINSGYVYLAFLFTASNCSAITGAYTVNFGASNAGNTSGYMLGRVWFCKVGSKLRIGLTKCVSTPTYMSTDYDYNRTYLVILRYEFVPGESNDEAKLWVRTSVPKDLTDLGTADITSNDVYADYPIGCVCIRQATNCMTGKVDGIRVGSGSTNEEAWNRLFIHSTYYDISAGNLSSLSGWTSRANGAQGTSPITFADPYRTYHIKNNASITLDNDWTLSGTNSKVILGDGANACSLTIPSDHCLNGIMDISGNAVLIAQNTSLPAIGTISPGSSIEYNGNSLQTISSRTDYQNIVVSNPAGVALDGNVVVNGNLVISNGSLELNGHSLIVNETLSCNGGAVNGTPTVDGYSDANNYLSIGHNGYSITSLSVASSLNPAIFLGKIKRFWTVGGTPNGTKSLTFRWTSSDDENHLWTEEDKPVVYLSGIKQTEGYVWSIETPRQVTITTSSFGAKGLWTIGADNGGTLPVELTSFTTVITPQNYIRLEWVTQSETGVRGYYLYRNSINNLNSAQVVSPLITASNTSQEQSYSYTDNEVAPGTYYYWLQSMDMDGQFAFHGPVFVTLTDDSNDGTPVIPILTSLQSIYPNPFNPTATIAFGLAKAEQVNIEIYNVRGARVRRLLSGSMNSGTYRRIWDGRDDKGRTLNSGLYIVKMTAGQYSSVQKAVLMK